MRAARAGIWQASVLALFALCFALPWAALREHGAGAALLALGATFAAWIGVAGRRQSAMALGMFSLLCVALPALASALAMAALGPWGALLGVAASLGAFTLYASLAGLQAGALLPGVLAMMVLAGDVGLAVGNLIVLVRWR
jgi:hypothetical protein